jgi:low temperature requirement protein LtrA
VPAGIAAVAIEPASTGHSTVFALSLAATRVVLAIAEGDWSDPDRRRVGAAYLVAAAMLIVSIWVSEPARYLVWAIAIAGESGAILREDRDAMRRARREHNFDALRPTDPADRLDPHHFAERFGLFLIILLGEVVVSAG